MLLIVDTFAKGREVVVARNQLIEIGGGFRLPEVLASSGARLREVGTTNKVYLADFERALSPETALLLRSHPSNFRIEGFTADVAPRELAALGRRTGLIVAEDLGSGALVDLARYGLPHERTVGEAVADGIDLIAWSGDKLFGGPQAGVIVGRRAAVARLRANPLLRALRVDKTTLAGLAATVRLHLEPERPRAHPVLRDAGGDDGATGGAGDGPMPHGSIRRLLASPSSRRPHTPAAGRCRSPRFRRTGSRSRLRSAIRTRSPARCAAARRRSSRAARARR